MSDRNHPIWGVINLLIIAIVATVFSYTNASNFDETELKMLTALMATLGGYEFLKSKIRQSLGMSSKKDTFKFEKEFEEFLKSRESSKPKE